MVSNSVKFLAGGLVALLIVTVLIFAGQSNNQTPAENSEPVDQVQKEIFKITAQQLFADYEKNEVAADERMKGNIVEVTGVVQSIDKDFTDSIVVSLATENQFMPARMYLDDSQKQTALELKRGLSITLDCQRMRRMVGSPSGADCKFNSNAHEKVGVSNQALSNNANSLLPRPEFTGEPLTAKQFAACIVSAAKIYRVPPSVLIGIMDVEGGHVGSDTVPDSEGNYEMGPMHVSSQLLPQFAHTWNVDIDTAHKWIRDDGCINMHIAAWVLQNKITQGGGTLFNGIALYHSDIPETGQSYANEVINALNKKGLIKQDTQSTENSGGETTAKPDAASGCKIKVGAVVCIEGPTSPTVTGENAATVYQMYGLNADIIHQSYTQAFLEAHNCIGVASSDHIIKEMGHGRIATPNGWVELTEADMDGKWFIVTATNYLVGTCEKMKFSNEKHVLPLSLSPGPH